MFKKAFQVSLVLMVALSMLLAACGGQAAKPTQAPAASQPASASNKAPTQAPQPTAAPPAKPTEFHGAWPYKVPPEGHYNTYVPNAISLGIYWDVMQMPGAMYIWAKDQWIPLMYTSWEFVPDKSLFVVHLRKGAKWSDGSDFTAKDVVTTFNVGRLFKWTVFKYVDDVKATDDYTVQFHMSVPSTVVQRYVLKERIRPASTYGEFGKKVADLLAAGKTSDSEEWKALQQEVTNFRPKSLVASGPYMIDPNSITEAQLTLVKNEKSWAAKQVNFDRLVIYNGETPTVTPLVLAGDIDYATHGFPPATEKQFIAQGIRIARPPIYSGPAIYFNNDVYPLNRAEVRQAIAYAINRQENGTVSLGKSGIAVKYMVGFSDSLVPLWLNQDQIKQLNTYDYNPQKAAEILTGIGFKKGDDGIWIDDKGKKMEFELTFPAEYADWSAAGQNAAEQLTKFGIKITPRGVQFQQHPTEIRQGKFQMAIRHWGSSTNPHPHFAYQGVLFRYNYIGSTEGKGMDFPMKQTVDGEEVDLEKLIIDSAKGLDPEAQKANVAKMAIVFNKLLPVVPLWERYGNNPVNETARVTNWPSDNDVLLKNSAYGDNFVIIALLQGILKPINK